MRYKDERIRLTSEVIHGIKVGIQFKMSFTRKKADV